MGLIEKGPTWKCHRLDPVVAVGNVDPAPDRPEESRAPFGCADGLFVVTIPNIPLTLALEFSTPICYPCQRQHDWEALFVQNDDEARMIMIKVDRHAPTMQPSQPNNGISSWRGYPVLRRGVSGIASRLDVEES